MAPDSIDDNCPALVTDAMKQHCGWHVNLGNVLREIWAAAPGTAARAQDEGSCPKCLTSLIGDILERTSGNSGVSVTTRVDWPTGWWNWFTLGYSTQANEGTWEKTCLWLCLRSESDTSVHQHTDLVYILFLLNVIVVVGAVHTPDYPALWFG